jgi:hypothetical protein
MRQSNLSLYVSRFPARWSNRPRLEGRGFGLPRTAGRFGATLGVRVARPKAVVVADNNSG